MALTALDSSVLIPAVAPWHAEHGRVDRVLDRPGRDANPVSAAVGWAPAPPQVSSISASSSAKEVLRARSRASMRFRTWACP